MRLHSIMVWREVASALGADPVFEALDELARTLPAHDAWGYSPQDLQGFTLAAYGLYRYFHPSITGIDRLPEGRVLIVPNHSGQLPLDGLVIGIACLVEARPPRICRAMMERWFPRVPYLGTALARAGAVLGDPVNCRNLLEQDQAILVFPEGIRGSGKTWWRRYQVQPFGRGFMRLALQTRTPIVPVSVVGAEESIISLYDLAPLARLLRMPYFPLPPALPLLGALAYLPMPTRFYLDFGEPMFFEGPHDDEDEVIDGKAELVRARIQGMVDARRATRESIF
jgi:1-acyl-sn-glycerol-3-phosphate acyltransferase